MRAVEAELLQLPQGLCAKASGMGGWLLIEGADGQADREDVTTTRSCDRSSVRHSTDGRDQAALVRFRWLKLSRRGDPAHERRRTAG